MKGKKVMRLATRGKRFGAFCLDAIIPAVAVITLFITAVSVLMFFPPMMGNSFGDPFSFGYGYGYGYGYRQPSTGGVTAAVWISIILLIGFLAAQLVLFSKSKTIGKAILGLQVVSSKTGEPIGFWEMLLREVIVKRASGAVCCLGYIWILIDDKNRGWHDKILDTYVVDLRESELLNSPQPFTQAPAQPVTRVEND